jgi:hypothetical protein
MESTASWKKLQRRISSNIGSEILAKFLQASLTRNLRYDSKRDNWCTLPNFERMYDDIYDAMTKGGIAKELVDWVYQDRKGNIVSEDDLTRYGQKTKHVLPILNACYL